MTWEVLSAKFIIQNSVRCTRYRVGGKSNGAGIEQ